VIESVHEHQIVQAQTEGLVDAETGAQDGTTFRACASRHRVVNRATLHKRQEILQSAIAADAAGQPGEQTPGWMAQTTSGRLEQAQRLERAHEVLEQRIAENAKKPKDKRLEENRVQVSLSDPVAPLGRDKEKVFCPLYTAQFLVAPISLLVIAWGVFAKATDAGTLSPMIDRAQKIVKGKLKKVLADAAYATLLDLTACGSRHSTDQPGRIHLGGGGEDVHLPSRAHSRLSGQGAPAAERRSIRDPAPLSLFVTALPTL
jgi:hypothetical protein